MIAIGSDHGGYKLKEEIKKYLEEKEIEYTDCGTFDEESVDYPDYIHPLAQDIQDGVYPLGIILCGSGNGAQMTANKHPNVRAALCWNVELGRLARQHNDANILTLPGRFIENELGWEIVQAYLTTDFEGGRHANRVAKINLK